MTIEADNAHMASRFSASRTLMARGTRPTSMTMVVIALLLYKGAWADY